MKRSRRLISLLVIVCTFLFASCASTTITNTWKDEDYQAKAKKIVVIMLARLPDLRNMFEGRFAAELQSRGNKAIQSNSIVTFEELPDRELVKSRIKSTGADTVLVARLVDSKTIDSYMPGHVDAIPLYYGTWGAYYAIVSVDYGQTVDLEVSYVETNLYDIHTEKLIWSAHSKTERAEGEQQLINKFIDVILKKMYSDNVIH